MSMPLFGSAGDFIATMKGQGMLGPLLTTLGVKPVKFKSESEFGKSIATESKVFSIYAVGVVKGYKRETRVRIHTVVDFRAAPTLGSLASMASSGAAAGASAAASAQPAAAGQAVNAIAAALQPSIGGQILYFSIE
jgi:general secretion pathway protein K